MDENEPCFLCNHNEKTFRLTCTVLLWKTSGYTNDNFISLHAYDTFDGGHDNIIDFEDLIEFPGLFEIDSRVNGPERPHSARNAYVERWVYSSPKAEVLKNATALGRSPGIGEVG
eukprot:gb/GECG01011753.1/.p1 GENE.gb/GECG01011753.1/~~gb/GECG01011753.1/.p1  ORF type:complete len:115 (+),score=11.22 gb/GECG01011753.1/:1-345(+)